VHAVVIQFHPDLIHTGLGLCPELAPVRRFLSRSSRGFQINGAPRETISRMMLEIAAGRGLPRLIALLQILECLAKTKDLVPLASARYAPELNASDQSRIGRVCEHINAHLTEPLDRDSLARIACLSPNAFSRFFKSRTGRTAPALINELRIGRACHLLEEGELSITDVAFSCGFNSLSNFQRQFIRRMRTTPSNYRAAAGAGTSPS
jgi:AraC-like DNA-binding protein